MRLMFEPRGGRGSASGSRHFGNRAESIRHASTFDGSEKMVGIFASPTDTSADNAIRDLSRASARWLAAVSDR